MNKTLRPFILLARLNSISASQSHKIFAPSLPVHRNGSSSTTRSLSFVSKQRAPGAFLSTFPHQKVINLEEVKKLIAARSDSSNDAPKLELFDVREPSEFAEGFIPTAANVPVGELDEALKLTDEHFLRKYGARKPSKDNQNVVFYCKAGIRSAKALDIAKTHGYACYVISFVFFV